MCFSPGTGCTGPCGKVKATYFHNDYDTWILPCAGLNWVCDWSYEAMCSGLLKPNKWWVVTDKAVFLGEERIVSVAHWLPLLLFIISTPHCIIAGEPSRNERMNTNKWKLIAADIKKCKNVFHSLWFSAFCWDCKLLVSLTAPTLTHTHVTALFIIHWGQTLGI